MLPWHAPGKNAIAKGDTMEIKSIDHIGLIVKDMEKAVRFYTDDMGFALTGEITPWAGSAEECAAMRVPEGPNTAAPRSRLPAVSASSLWNSAPYSPMCR